MRPTAAMVAGPSQNEVLLPTIRVKLFTESGIEVFAKALLDSGSQSSFITSELVHMLGLKPKDIKRGIIGIGNARRQICQSVDLTLHSCNSSFSMPINCYVIEQITTKLPQSHVNIKLPPNLTLADATFDTPSNIQILMAADVFFQIILPGKQHESSVEHVANSSNQLSSSSHFLNTKFGYVVAGTFSNISQNQYIQKKVVNLMCKSCDYEINKNLENFWKTEAVPEVFQEGNVESEQCEDFFRETVELTNNKFQVSLPLKVSLKYMHKMLGDSFHLALKRFYNTERKLQREPLLYNQYKAFIDEYVALGHGSYININKYDLTFDPVYFLPHHAVLRPDKKTTKCRVVFDASMLTSKSRCLNDLLLNGPTVQRDLIDILLLFRLGSYVFSTDLKSMFRCIELKPDYRSLQLILWREAPSENIKCIELNTVTYGFKCSTFLATRCLLELAVRYEKEYPMASFILRNQTYVDDILVSSMSIDLLQEMKYQLINLLSLGGFQAHKWSSNCASILSDIPKEKQHFDDVDIQKENYFLKTLGVTYNTKTDSFKISSPEPHDTEPSTKRDILSYIARFYDPLGLAGPITVLAKVIIQKLWLAKLDWDSALPKDLHSIWMKFYTNLINMTPIHVNRNVTPHSTYSIQLIGFADAASSTAYGCCLYLRVSDEKGNINTSLLCSKSRVIPLSQKLTVPRLELNAALLLAKLCHRVYSILSLQLKITDVFLYSDSEVVLAWLKTEITRLNLYVANRVKMIANCTKGFSWYYICTEENPADCLSRGVLPQELASHSLWWHGPLILSNHMYAPQSNQHPNTLRDVPEVKARVLTDETCVMFCKSQNSILCLDFIYKYSSISKMQRVLSYVRRFCFNLRYSNVIKLNYITSEELNEALLLIIKYEQQRYFSVETQLLIQNKSLDGSFKALNPFIDANGIIRVGGRLDCATIPHSQKHPIVLPTKSKITELIIVTEHIKNLHAGPKIVLSSLNQKFWLINGISLIKKVIYSCVICFRLKAQAAKALMGSLPTNRVIMSRPFQRVGIDYAGPFAVKQARIRRSVVSKGYICVFVCFATKAVHLELVSNLTTPAFLACFKRFVARRGLPSDVYSDNASTFKGARNQLDELYKLLASKAHKQQVQSQSAQEGIRFHFIPSYSPVMGGLWEAAVKSTKYHLKRVVQRALLTYEELNTVLVQIESILNSRPLTPLSTDINDYSYLTPGHFLIGTALNTYPEQNLSDSHINRLSFWNICTSMFQQFWKIWRKHYLNVLQCRPKWQDNYPNIKVGSLVILVENDVQPLFWPMARVINVFPGADGIVRTVEVRAQNGNIHRRSITKVCLLPIDVN